MVQKQVISGAPSVAHELGSESQLYNYSDPLSPFDWTDVIDNMPLPDLSDLELPSPCMEFPSPDMQFPDPYMEFPSPHMETPVGTPSMMSAETPTTMVRSLLS